MYLDFTNYVSDILGERDYACEICGATYVTGTDLKRHRLKHDDVKPYPCQLCRKQFTRSHDLKVKYCAILKHFKSFECFDYSYRFCKNSTLENILFWIYYEMKHTCSYTDAVLSCTTNSGCCTNNSG